MDRRYQVFVSSTYADLTDERREVIQALLELDCIPAGMELFPAADDDQWKLIQNVIDDCDYYLVIVAGRYGSLHKDGLSFTEKEYRYALEKKKPIIGFVHHDISQIPSGNVEKEGERREKLDSFIELVKQKPVRFWKDGSELGSQISRSLIKLIKSHPSPGWVKADGLSGDKSAAEEMLALRKEIDRLKGELETTAVEQPAGTESLSQGDDLFSVSITVEWNVDWLSSHSEGFSVDMPWNEIVFAVGPHLMASATTLSLKEKLEEHIKASRNFSQSDYATSISYEIEVLPGAIDTIIVQLIALGVIKKSIKNRSVKDTNTYWDLTPYGEKLTYDVRAISKNPAMTNSALPTHSEGNAGA